MNKYFILFTSLVFVFFIIFLIPGSVEKFSLTMSGISDSEYWRFLTYQFTHLNLGHLFTNIFALGIVVFLAFELHSSISRLSSTYFLSGLLAVLPLWTIFAFTALGASVAIYGAFGMVSWMGKNYGIKPFVLIAALVILNLLVPTKEFINCGTCSQFITALKQSGAHISGLVFGSLAFFSLDYVHVRSSKRKESLLRGLNA